MELAGGVVKAAVAMPHGAIDPIRVNDSGSYQLIFQVAEFLCVTRARSDPEAGAGGKLVAQRRWQRLDLQAAARREVSQRRGDARRGCGGELRSAVRSAATYRMRCRCSKDCYRRAARGKSTIIPSPFISTRRTEISPTRSPSIITMQSFCRRIIAVTTRVTSWEPDRSGCESYRPREGATFVRNPDYWGPKALPDRIEFKFYSDIQPRLLALQTGEVDMLDAIPVVMSPAIRANPDIRIMQVRSANHRQLHMRCDAGAVHR